MVGYSSTAAKQLIPSPINKWTIRRRNFCVEQGGRVQRYANITPALTTKLSAKITSQIVQLFIGDGIRLLGFLSIAFALFAIAGGPLIVLQGVAWTGMVQEYSKNDTLANALQKTFSGKYRCSLCKKIAKETQKEKTTTGVLKTEKSLKAALSVATSETFFTFAKKISYPQIITLDYRSIIQEPPTPYPRAV